MRTALVLDDDLLERAQGLIGPMEKTALVREALKALIQRESAKRLVLLGGAVARERAATPVGAKVILVDMSVWINAR